MPLAWRLAYIDFGGSLLIRNRLALLAFNEHTSIAALEAQHFIKPTHFPRFITYGAVLDA